MYLRTDRNAQRGQSSEVLLIIEAEM